MYKSHKEKQKAPGGSQRTIGRETTPIIPASQNLPEITPRAIVLGIVLAMLLAASTCYLGLKVGRTIAGSIPAALISMSILRWFRGSNILENNIVQTAASAGECLAAAMIFTLPALVILGLWQEFHFGEIFLIATVGGSLGVLLTVPLRRLMIVRDRLPYPEGLATAEVLRVGDSSTAREEVRGLLSGVALGGVITFLQTALKVAAESVQAWGFVGKTVMGFGLGCSPVLMAAGFIVKLRVTLCMLIGSIITWVIGIPLYGYLYGMPEAPSAQGALMLLYRSHFRYMAVGVMTIGGLWGFLSFIKPMAVGVRASLQAMRDARDKNTQIPRTERDIPMHLVALGILLMGIPILMLFSHIIEEHSIVMSPGIYWAVLVLSVLFALIMSFMAASIAAYLTGIAGTTSLPVSGIGISAILSFALLLLLILSHQAGFSGSAEYALKAAGMTIMFTAIVCAAASMSGDNMQDLKAGYVVGATPWKQQVMLLVGVVASALVICPVLQLLLNVYGIGDVLPKTVRAGTHTLAAPQATLMATVAKGVFAHDLNWPMIKLGVGIGIVFIIVDEYLKRNNSAWRMPPLSVALGMYLPIFYITAFVLGGFIHTLATRSVRRYCAARPNMDAVAMQEEAGEQGVMLASGIIAGEAIMGLLLAIPFALLGSDEVLSFESLIKKFSPDFPGVTQAWPHFEQFSNILGLLMVLIVASALFRKALSVLYRKN